VALSRTPCIVASSEMVHIIITKAPSNGRQLATGHSAAVGRTPPFSKPDCVVKELLDGRARWFQSHTSSGPRRALVHSAKGQDQGTFSSIITTSPRARAYAARRIIDNAAEGAFSDAISTQSPVNFGQGGGGKVSAQTDRRGRYEAVPKGRGARGPPRPNACSVGRASLARPNRSHGIAGWTEHVGEGMTRLYASGGGS
jgi:hypothetical protein